jgi:hypothetical protein
MARCCFNLIDAPYVHGPFADEHHSAAIAAAAATILDEQHRRREALDAARWPTLWEQSNRD